MSEPQVRAFVLRVKALIALDPFKSKPEYWAESIGLHGEHLAAVLRAYEEDA